MAHWSSREARAKLNRLTNATLKDGPQIMTWRGKETVVFVSMEEWNLLKVLQP